MALALWFYGTKNRWNTAIALFFIDSGKPNRKKTVGMRIILQILVLLSGIAIAMISIGAGFFAATADSPAFAPCVGIVAAIVVIVVAAFAFNRLNNFGRTKMDSWLSTVASSDFKYAFDGTGIAVTKSKQTVCLAQKIKGRVLSKEYPFSEIRGWETEIAGEILMVGGRNAEKMGIAFRNLAAQERTGLLLSVKDIDFPNWFIKFGNNLALGKNTKREIERWMEILRQTINE